MLAIQKFIKLFDNIELANARLSVEFGISVTKDNLGKTKDDPCWVYVYNSTPTSETIHNPLVREANGLILDKEGRLISKLLEHPYTLANLSQIDFNWKSARLIERYKGTIVALYRYKKTWYVQTQFSANAEVNIDNTKLTVNNKVRRALYVASNRNTDSMFDPFDFMLDGDNSVYIFEYLSENAISDKKDLKLTAIYDKENFTYHPFDIVETICSVFNREYVDYVDIKDANSALEIVDLLAENGNGVVVTDNKNTTLLLQHTSHYVKGKINKLEILKIIKEHYFNGTLEDLVLYYPNCKELALLFKRVIGNLMLELEYKCSEAEKMSPIELRKSFVDYPFSLEVIRKVENSNTSFSDLLKNVSRYKLVQLLKAEVSYNYAINKACNDLED